MMMMPMRGVHIVAREMNLVVVDEEGAGVINVSKEFGGESRGGFIFGVVTVFVVIGDRVKESAINDGVVVEMGGDVNHICIEKMGVNSGWPSDRGEVSSKSASGRIHGSFVDVGHLFGNLFSPHFGLQGSVVIFPIKDLKELAHGVVAIHHAVVGTVRGSTGKNRINSKMGDGIITVAHKVDQVLNVGTFRAVAGFHHKCNPEALAQTNGVSNIPIFLQSIASLFKFFTFGLPRRRRFLAGLLVGSAALVWVLQTS